MAVAISGVSLRGKGPAIEEARRVRNAAIIADAATMTKRQLEKKHGVCFSGIMLILKQAGVEAVYDRGREGKNIIYNWKKKKVRVGNETHLICTRCEVQKSIDAFYDRGFICRKCTSDRATEWNRNNKSERHLICRTHHDKNRDKINKSSRARYHLNITKENERAKKYHADHRAERTRYVKGWIKRKKKSDPKFRALLTCRRRMWILFKSAGKKKSLRSAQLLGIDKKGFFAHIESLFQPGMTWENRGRYGWHIDHKKPCALFDMTDPEQAKACWHYTNLQPMWHTDNLRKGKKYTEINIDRAEDSSISAVATVEQSMVSLAVT